MTAISNITPETAGQLQALPSPIPLATDGSVISAEHHNSLRTAVGLIAHSVTKIAAGQTAPGADWQVYSPSGIQIDVDTSAGAFTSTPIYVASVGGVGSHWMLTGTSAIYIPTPTGFRIYVRRSDDAAISPATASANGWHVKWIGI